MEAFHKTEADTHRILMSNAVCQDLTCHTGRKKAHNARYKKYDLLFPSMKVSRTTCSWLLISWATSLTFQPMIITICAHCTCTTSTTYHI